MHDSIKCGPEYICTCCDQFWYRSSVTKCDANKYTKCTKNLLDVCITGKTSVDKTEWVCSTCHSNLSDGKLPVCSKANKTAFPVKPECLRWPNTVFKCTGVRRRYLETVYFWTPKIGMV